MPCSSDEFLGALPRACLPPTGIFIYPLEESEVVAGFEAAAGSRRVTFQVQSRHRAQDCCLECRISPGRPRRCAAGEYHGATICMARWGAPRAGEPQPGHPGALEAFGTGDPGVSSPGGWRSCSSSSPLPLCPGHLVLDEDAERSTFVISTGSLGPAESLAVTLRTAQELPTLPGGALRLVLPPVLAPRVAAAPERESEPGSLCDDRLALW